MPRIEEKTGPGRTSLDEVLGGFAAAGVLVLGVSEALFSVDLPIDLRKRRLLSVLGVDGSHSTIVTLPGVLGAMVLGALVVGTVLARLARRRGVAAAAMLWGQRCG